MIEQCKHLSPSKWESLMSLIKNWFLNGTLGKLKDDAKPGWLRPYPVPRVYEAMFRK